MGGEGEGSLVAGVGFLLEGPKARSPCLDRSQSHHGLSRDRYPYAERTLLVLSPAFWRLSLRFPQALPSLALGETLPDAPGLRRPGASRSDSLRFSKRTYIRGDFLKQKLSENIPKIHGGLSARIQESLFSLLRRLTKPFLF